MYKDQELEERFFSLIYYMFLGGVYHQSSEEVQEKTFWESIWGYMLVYFLYLTERILL